MRLVRKGVFRRCTDLKELALIALFITMPLACSRPPALHGKISYDDGNSLNEIKLQPIYDVVISATPDTFPPSTKPSVVPATIDPNSAQYARVKEHFENMARLPEGVSWRNGIFQIDGKEYPPLAKTSLIDLDGHYAFDSLPPGDYFITVVYHTAGDPGQRDATPRKVTINTGDSVQFDFTMTRYDIIDL